MSRLKKTLVKAWNSLLWGIDYPFTLRQREICLNEVSKILLIRQDCLGDIIVSLPAFEAVAKSVPAAKIHILVASRNCSLLKRYPFASKVLCGLDELDDEYDIAINFLPKYKANVLLSRIRARYKIGYVGCGGAWLLTHSVWNDRRTRPLHEIERNLEFAERLLPGRKFSTDINFALTAQEQRQKPRFLESHHLQNHPFVVMHPGASREYLRWPAENYSRLAERLTSAMPVKVVFTYGHGDDDVIRTIRQRPLKNTMFFNITDLTELKLLYSQALLYMGNVTGPMHMAVSQKIPVVAVSVMKHNVDDMRYWGPRGVHDVVVYPDEAYAAVDFDDGSCARLLSAISVEKVYAAVLEVMRRRQPEMAKPNDQALT